MMKLRRRPPTAVANTVEGAVPIGAAPRREPVTLCGEIVRIRTKPTIGLPTYFVTISDGTGNAIALLTGRFNPPPLGSTVVIKGVGYDTREGIRFMNPSLRLA